MSVRSGGWHDQAGEIGLSGSTGSTSSHRLVRGRRCAERSARLRIANSAGIACAKLRFVVWQRIAGGRDHILFRVINNSLCPKHPDLSQSNLRLRPVEL